jgi:hypothetical protein
MNEKRTPKVRSGCNHHLSVRSVRSLIFALVGEKTPTKATVKVIDLQGRLIKSFECNANQVTALGNELKPGVYMVEVRMGNEVKTVRAVSF